MASSSSAMNSTEYDVFLSFRGADTRNSFTSHLYNALCKEGVNAFMDKRLERGEEISSTLFQMIESSKISIVVFSEKYASSEFCLDELLKILDCKASRGQVVLPVFHKVDPLEVEKRTGSYGEALCRFKEEFNGCERLKTCSNGEESIKEKMKKVELWGKALAEAADLAGWDLHNRDEAEIIQDIVKFVLQKLKHGELERVQVGVSAPHPCSEVFPEKRLVGKNLENSIEQIWSWLTDDDVSSIGIWGMGGVGKTTLLINIRNLLLHKGNVFDQIYWVTVSQDFSVQNLQNLIASEILLDFGSEKGLLKRAARLSNALKSKGKFVLILDDLWNHFDMNKVGIPIESNGCKLIITTRSQSVCTRIGLQKLKKIEPLSEEDAWDLFKETMGHDLGKNVEPTAKNVAKECGGLPLGIVTMAGSMRRVDDIHEWNNALAELKRSEVRPDDMEVEVFPILKFSYTRLNDWMLQQCFLFCALFPEDHLINKDKLIDFFIAEGIMKRQTSRQMDLDKGHAMLNKLVKVSLLENVEKYGGICIKMHDLIRDMAIQIMKESCPSIVEAGRQLEHVPEENYWTDSIVWVSLMRSYITEIPYFSPMCRTLSTLLLSQNRNLKSIPDSFFLHFCGLKVLDLSETGIEMLPKSVGCLGNLKALSLKRCDCLCYIPPLGKLTSLELLDVSSCWRLRNIPEGLELLSKLIFLDLSSTGISNIQPGMLTRLYHLQFLAFGCACRSNSCAISEVEVKELAALQKLETLSWHFHDFTKLNEFLQLVSRMQRGWKITNYFLSVGLGTKLEVKYGPISREIHLCYCKIDRELYIQKDLQRLAINNVTFRDGTGLLLKTVSSETELIDLSISLNKGMKYLFHLSSCPSILAILETLILGYLPDLLVLFGEEEEESPAITPSVPCSTPFCNLRMILISGCNNMKSLCSPRLFSNFHNLRKIRIAHCSEMEVIVATSGDKKSCDHNHFNLVEKSLFNLSTLTSFELIDLPKLKRICSEKIVCGSLLEFVVLDCCELEKIPISLPLLSLGKLVVWPEEWWNTVQWGSPDQKSELQPKFSRSKYLVWRKPEDGNAVANSYIL